MLQKSTCQAVEKTKILLHWDSPPLIECILLHALSEGTEPTKKLQE